MGVLEQIAEQQREIILRLQHLERNILSERNLSKDTSMITSKDIIKDLGISSRTFTRMVPDMPFLMRVGQQYRARRCDFEKWKQANN